MVRTGWPAWGKWIAASLGILGLAALYLVGLRFVLDSSMPGTTATADERDAQYLALHGAILLAALVAGFVLGKIARGSGAAWAVLFATAAVLIMAGTLIGSRELACDRDVNDLVRHWQCDP